MKIKVKDTPYRLSCRDVACVQVELDLVILIDLHRGTIVPFVDVLVDVLDGGERDSALDIDMTVVSMSE